MKDQILQLLANSGILATVIGGILMFAYSKFKKVIRGTALEAELGELVTEVIKGTRDGHLDLKEGKAIGKEGIDTLKAVKELIAKKKNK